MANKKVVVLPGDDAAPEAMAATMDALRALELPIDYVEFPPGDKWVRGETDAAARRAIDASDTTLFGSTFGQDHRDHVSSMGQADVRQCEADPLLEGF